MQMQQHKLMLFRKLLALSFCFLFLLSSCVKVQAEEAEDSEDVSVTDEQITEDEGSMTSVSLEAYVTAHPNSKLTIDDYLGAYNFVNHLKYHRYDNFYRGTTFRRVWTTIRGTSLPQGQDPNGTGGMNCIGFVSSVFRNCGADLDKIYDTDGWHYVNVWNWEYTIQQNKIKTYRYDSWEDALASGKLQQGDLVYFRPKSNSDPHIAIFWGSTSSTNLVWHSIPMGNAIGHIDWDEESDVFIFPLSRSRLSNVTSTKTTGISSGVKITWDSMKGAKSYRIFRKKDGDGVWTEIGTAKSSETSYLDTKAKLGVTYRYAVAAVDKNGQTGTFNEYGKKGGRTPTVTKCAVTAEGSVQLKWYRVGAAAGYKIYRANKRSGKYTLVKKLRSNTTFTWTDTTVTAGKTYYYKVLAYNKNGKSSYTPTSRRVKVPKK